MNETTCGHGTNVKEVSAWCQGNLVADLGGHRREAWLVGAGEGRETGDKNIAGSWASGLCCARIEQCCAQEIMAAAF